MSMRNIDKPIQICHIMGTWSPNIGNAFFQLGGLHFLNTICPDASVTIINEKPGYPQYWNPKGGNPDGYFDMASHVQSDFLVLMGPMFRPETENIWGDSLQRICANGTKIILLGVAAMNYEDEFIRKYAKFLKKVRPYILSSRDEETFNKLGEFAVHAHNGIDLAFFIPDYYKLTKFTNENEYVVFNFDKSPEPKISIIPEEHRGKLVNEKQFIFSDQIWSVKTDYFRTRMARKSRYFMFLESLLYKGEQTTTIGDFRIIRTDHRASPIVKQRTFRYPNVMVNDTPYPYFQIYGNAELILSNRLHACVIGLSYGKPVMLFSESPRLRLLERLHLEGFKDHPITLDLKYLEEQKNNLKEFMRGKIC